MTDKKTYQFKTEIEQLLDILANSLYTNKEIFLRELISNASDTLGKIKFLSLTDSKILAEDSELKISIKVDEKKKIFEIEDNGMGMSEKELQENIGTIAKSGTVNFLKGLKDKKAVEQIGKFGVGFYSVFMVTDEVIVETTSYKDKKSFRWISQGKNNYSIEPITKKTMGTKISFTFRKEQEDFANPLRISNIIQKYSNFVSFPITVNGEQKNQPEAIWRKSKTEIKEEEYTNFFKYLSNSQTEPLHRVHYNVEAPVQFNSLFFISKEKEVNPFHPDNQELNRLHLYIKKVFIQDNCKGLAPQWMRFIYGVVDIEDLPLNISREVTQDSPLVLKINRLLVKKVIAELKKIAKTDFKKFTQMWNNFGSFIKEGIYGDYENKEQLLNIYYCNTSKSPDKLIALSEIVENKAQDTKEIYYVYGKSKSIIEANPNIEYFLKKEIEILYLYTEVDEFILPVIGNYKEVSFLPIDRAKIEEDKQEKKPDDKLKEQKKDDFLIFVKELLKDKVADVVASKRLVGSPCTLVSSSDSMTESMEKMMQMMQKDFKTTKKVLEINLNNPLIKEISVIKKIHSQDPLLKDVVEQLYDNAKLVKDASEETNEMIARINRMMQIHLETHRQKIQNNNNSYSI